MEKNICLPTYSNETRSRDYGVIQIDFVIWIQSTSKVSKDIENFILKIFPSCLRDCLVTTDVSL